MVASYGAGDEIGGYRLEESIGGGGYGSVWRARHVASGDVAALKLLDGQYSEADAGRIRAEVELLATSAARSSPHVVRVLDGGTEPVPYVVMEYIEGGDLRSELAERGALSVAETLEVARSVLDALRVLDESGIIHRDIKPANVMRDADGAVKLTDFGIAKIVGYDTVTATGQLPLSMAYAAPEAWDGRSEHRSDVYSVGILLYQCLVGEPPFGGTYAEVYRRHLAEAPDLGKLPPGTPPSLRSLIARSLEKEPERRPSAVEALPLVDAARSELEQATDPRGSRPPTRFGPWQIVEPHPARPWAFRCQHEDTGRGATVEVIAADELSVGDDLQRAVGLSAELVALGAEPLLDSSRLVLRPGEAWPEAPPGRFQFWVAREEVPAGPPSAIDSDALIRAARSAVALRARLEELGLPFAPGGSDVTIGPAGLLVRRAGLPGTSTDGDGLLLAAFASWDLTPQARALLESSPSLAALAGAGGPEEPSTPVLATPPPGGSGISPLRGAAVVLALLASGVTAVGALFIALGGGDSESPGPPTPTPTTVVEPTLTPTPTAALPGLIVEDAFDGNAAAWLLDGSATLDDGALVLTTPRGEEQGIAWLREPVTGPFIAEFDYRAGGAVNAIGGHGLVFMFYKRAANPALGAGCLTFGAGSPCVATSGVPVGVGAADIAGYGIEFDAHLNGLGEFTGYPGDPSAAHVALILDSPGNHLASADDPRVEDDEWHSVQVRVGTDSVIVELDGDVLLDWTGALDRSFGGLGFAATTTSAETNWHLIDNVRIALLDEPTPTPTPAPPPREHLRVHRLDVGACEIDASEEPPTGVQPAVLVEFVNETGEMATIFADENGTLTQLTALAAGQRMLIAGDVGDRWLLADSRGDCLGTFRVQAQPPPTAQHWTALISTPSGTRIYRNEVLGFEFLRPDDQFVQVLSGGSQGLAGLALGQRIEIFVVDAAGLGVDAYATESIGEAVVRRQSRAPLDGRPAVTMEYSETSGAPTEVATFVVEDGVAHVLSFRAGGDAATCTRDLAAYRLLARTFRFLEGAEAPPTQLASPEIAVSEEPCGGSIAVPSGAPAIDGLITSIGCGPTTLAAGDTIVCSPDLVVAPSAVCWTIDAPDELEGAPPPRDCAAGETFLTTSFATEGVHTVTLTACITGGCEQRVATILVGASASIDAAPRVETLDCSPRLPRPGDTVTCSPTVAGEVVEACWRSSDPSFLEEERCGTSLPLSGSFAARGSHTLTLRVCGPDGLCSEAAQLMPVERTTASAPFAPELRCTSIVPLDSDVQCDIERGELVAVSAAPPEEGGHAIEVTSCLGAAPLQPAICATETVAVSVAADVVLGTLIRGEAVVGSARVDLLVEGGADEAPVVLRRAYAHSDGRYVIASPPAGTYTLVVFEGEDGAWVERTRVEVAVAGSGVEELDLIDLAIEPDGA